MIFAEFFPCFNWIVLVNSNKRFMFSKSNRHFKGSSCIHISSHYWYTSERSSRVTESKGSKKIDLSSTFNSTSSWTKQYIFEVKFYITFNFNHFLYEIYSMS